MPTYDYICNSCKHVFEQNEIIDNRDNPTKEKCPNCGKKKVKREMTCQKNLIVDSVRIGVRKPDGGIREVLTEIKKNHPRGNIEIR